MGRFEDRATAWFRPQTQLEWYRCAVGQRYTERGCAGAAERLAWSDVDAYLAEISEKSGDSWRVPTGRVYGARGRAVHKSWAKPQRLSE